MKIELVIQNGGKLIMPNVQEGITWNSESKGMPGKLTFTVVQDEKNPFEEGNPISFKVDGQGVFYGFIFSRQWNKDGLISVTAYDQLRYLKNKDTYNYTNKTATEVIQMIADDFKLQTGELEDTTVKIPSRIEDNATLFDIIQNALDFTLQEKGVLYTLSDEFGKFTLKSLRNMSVGVFIDNETAQNFDYSSSIDDETYNKIKLAFDNEKTGKREIYIAQSLDNINKWGVLQYFENLEEVICGQSKADSLLNIYNRKGTKLTLKGVLGDIRANAGTLLGISINLGEGTLMSLMLVDKAVHTFKESEYMMDLTLQGEVVNG